MSQRTAAGCQKAPTRFLPSGRLTPVLPPMAASTWPSRVVGTCTTRDAPVVDGCGEAGHVGDHPPAERDHHVGPGQAPPGEAAAERLDGLEVLGLLTVVEEKGALLHAGVHGPWHVLLGDDGGPVGTDREHLDQAVAGTRPRPGPE